MTVSESAEKLKKRKEEVVENVRSTVDSLVGTVQRPTIFLKEPMWKQIRRRLRERR